MRYKETIIHLLLYCEKVKPFWIQVEELMYEFDSQPINFGVDTVLCNKIIQDTKNVKNFICLLAKQYIYRKRCEGNLPNIHEFKRHVYKNKKYGKVQCNCK